MKKKGDNPVTQFHDEVVVKDKDRLKNVLLRVFQ